MVNWFGSIIFVTLNTNTMTHKVDTHGELLLLVSDAGEMRDPYSIMNRITISYMNGKVNDSQRDLLFDALYRNCISYDINVESVY